MGAAQALTLPDKPSRAVLPFRNLTGDAEQDYFVDGLVEEITTAIARLLWLFVIARNTGKTPQIPLLIPRLVPLLIPLPCCHSLRLSD